MNEIIPINVFIILDEFKDYGIGDTIENARDDYDDAFGSGKTFREFHLQAAIRDSGISVVAIELPSI